MDGRWDKAGGHKYKQAKWQTLPSAKRSPSVRMKMKTRPDRRPSVADGWAGAELSVFPLFNSMVTDGRTDGRTDKASYRVACPELKREKIKPDWWWNGESVTGKLYKKNLKTLDLKDRWLLVADTQLYKRLCPSVGRSVDMSQKVRQQAF